LIIDLFGAEIGAHARSAVGMAELPFDIPVEIEGEVTIRDDSSHPPEHPDEREPPAHDVEGRHPVVNGWLAIPNSFAAETMAAQAGTP
jgi:hypothetical protein